MQAKDLFELNDIEFEQTLLELSTLQLTECQNDLRAFSLQFRQKPPKHLSERDKAKLRNLSKKMHDIKKECEKREHMEKNEKRKQALLESTSKALCMEDLDFKETIQYMDLQDFENYLGLFEHKYRKILRNRQTILKNTGTMPLEELREKLTIIRRWDSMETEIKNQKEKQRLN